MTAFSFLLLFVEQRQAAKRYITSDQDDTVLPAAFCNFTRECTNMVDYAKPGLLYWCCSPSAFAERCR